MIWFDQSISGHDIVNIDILSGFIHLTIAYSHKGDSHKWIVDKMCNPKIIVGCSIVL